MAQDSAQKFGCDRTVASHRRETFYGAQHMSSIWSRSVLHLLICPRRRPDRRFFTMSTDEEVPGEYRNVVAYMAADCQVSDSEPERVAEKLRIRELKRAQREALRAPKREVPSRPSSPRQPTPLEHPDSYTLSETGKSHARSRISYECLIFQY